MRTGQFERSGIVALGVVAWASFAAPAFGGGDAAGRASASEEAVAVYTAFLEKWREGSQGTLLVAETLEPAPEESKWRRPNCVAETVVMEVAGSSDVPVHLKRTTLSTMPGVKLVNPKRWKPIDPGEAIGLGGNVDKAVKEGMNHSLLSFSVVLFDQKHELAVMTYSSVCGGLCGSGGVVIFEKHEDGWKERKANCEMWIS